VGRAPLRLFFRFDIADLAHVKVKGFGGDEEANGVTAEWLTRIVVSWELLVGWAIIWITAHFSMVLIAGTILHTSGAPKLLLLFVEVIPGVSVIVHTIRLGILMPRFMSQIRAVGAAEKKGAPAPAWTKRRGILMSLTSASDLDLLFAIGIAAIIGFATR
jgi:hypothetical protein